MVEKTSAKRGRLKNIGEDMIKSFQTACGEGVDIAQHSRVNATRYNVGGQTQLQEYCKVKIDFV